jgi:hypothetical protein
MAVTNEQILSFLTSNPNLTDAQIAATMQEFSVTPAQMAAAVGVPVAAVQERYVAVAPDTNTTENINKLASQILSQGTTEAWTGGLPPEKAALYMASDLAKSGVSNIEQITKTDSGIVNAMTGEKLVSGYGERTGGNLWSGSYEGKGNTGFGVNFDAQGKPIFYTQGASSSTLKNDILKLAAVAGAAYGLTGGFEGLLGSAAGTTGAGLTAAETAAGTVAGTVGTTGMTMAELAQLDLALGGAGGTLGAETLAGALTSGALVPTLANLTGNSGLLTTPVVEMGAGTGLTTKGALGLGSAAGVASLGGATGAGLTAGTAGLGAAGTGAGLVGATTGGLVVGNSLLGGTTLGSTLGTLGAAAGGSLLGSTAGSTLGSLLSSGLTLGGGLLQSQTSKEAALAAQQRIDAETTAAKQAAAFRPIGMTTRFGTSQFAVDPVTGQLTSAGYTLSPEAKAQQDRFVALSNQGLTQAEAAQAQFAPLQTGAQNLFSLGNQYISQSPESVAQNYINQQMALLQPGRELELATLQNKLQQQGRGGLSVAQGGTYGATTPELQALYNARAKQEAELAASAQQAGQKDVLFGAGLLGQGSTAMGDYYAGQQAAYAPYTTAMTQAKDLETLAQKPFTMATDLAQLSSAAGGRVGQLGLTGAQQSVALATGNAATNNPYAQLLAGLGGSSTFGTAAGNALTGLFS